MLDPVALLVLVVVLDAAVIAGIVVARLAGLRSARRAATSFGGSIDDVLVRDRFTELADSQAVAARLAGAPRSEPPSEAASAQAAPASTAAAPEAEPSTAVSSAPSSAADSETPRTVMEEVDSLSANGADRTAGETAALQRPPVAVGPGNTAFETDEWRRALRRERARVARYGRAATIMQLELDLESSSTGAGMDLGEAEDVLEGLVNTAARSSDYVARTARGRFHLILSETPEARASGLADRIRTRYVQSAPDGPQLLIGWAGAASPNGLAASSWRAAERVDQDRRRLQEADQSIAAGAPGRRAGASEARAWAAPVAPNAPPVDPTPAVAPVASKPAGAVDPAGAPTQTEASIEGSLATLERLRGLGLVSEDEYREKRSEILARL